MSNETKLYGYIEVPVYPRFDVQRAIELNWRAINYLPDEGDWPHLIIGIARRCFARQNMGIHR